MGDSGFYDVLYSAHALPSINEPGERLRVFWRCGEANELGDVR